MPSELTPREEEIMHLLYQGKSNAEIASTLGIKIATVKAHISKILLKLNANSRLHAVSIYLDHLFGTPEKP